jgi:hypothetical protein
MFNAIDSNSLTLIYNLHQFIHMVYRYLLKFAAFLIILNFCFTALSAQDEKLKAIFIYNFTRYVDWPDKPGNFIITIIGNDPITAEIQSIAAKKTVGASKIEVKNARTPADLTTCHILYIPESKPEILASFLVKAKDLNILIVSENKDACLKGSCINFIDNSGKINFEISKANIENNGLKVSGELMQLGIAIN